MNKVSTIGLDLAKEVFQVHGADAAGAVVFRKRLRRSSVVRFFATVLDHSRILLRTQAAAHLGQHASVCIEGPATAADPGCDWFGCSDPSLPCSILNRGARAHALGGDFDRVSTPYSPKLKLNSSRPSCRVIRWSRLNLDLYPRRPWERAFPVIES